MATIRYKGDGSEFLNGVPAHNLTTEEYDALDNDQRAAVRASPLYDYASYRDAQKADDAKPAPKAEPAPKETPA